MIMYIQEILRVGGGGVYQIICTSLKRGIHDLITSGLVWVGIIRGREC